MSGKSETTCTPGAQASTQGPWFENQAGPAGPNAHGEGQVEDAIWAGCPHEAVHRFGAVPLGIHDAQKPEGLGRVLRGAKLMGIVGRNIDDVTQGHPVDETTELSLSDAAQRNDHVLVVMLLQRAETTRLDLEVSHVELG